MFCQHHGGNNTFKNVINNKQLLTLAEGVNFSSTEAAIVADEITAVENRTPLCFSAMPHPNLIYVNAC